MNTHRPESELREEDFPLDHAPILLAEDNPDDAALMKRAFQKAGLVNPIHIVENGAEAIEYLKNSSRLEDSFPLFMFLDLKMPRFSGFEVLSWIRDQPHLANLPVVIVTQSKLQPDINRAFHLGANAYWIKPSTFRGLVRMIEMLRDLIGNVTQKVETQLAQEQC